MECKNHPGIEAIDRCAGCAEAFCDNCLVEVQGQKYCGSCKVMAVEGTPPTAQVQQAMIPCKEAKDALVYAIIGLFCVGFILEPMALVKASKAKKLIKMNPNLSGEGQATAATVIAIVGIGLWVLIMIAQIASIASGSS